MGYSAIKWRLCRLLRVEMDELPVLGHVGELVDSRLIYLEPARHPDLLSGKSCIPSCRYLTYSNPCYRNDAAARAAAVNPLVARRGSNLLRSGSQPSVQSISLRLSGGIENRRKSAANALSCARRSHEGPSSIMRRCACRPERLSPRSARTDVAAARPRLCRRRQPEFAR
jgi:hypothetical protein